MTGAKLSIKFYERIEAKMEEKRIAAEEAAREAAERAEEEKEQTLLQSNHQEALTYEGSLKILGVSAEDAFSSIYNQYLLLSNNLQAVQAREACDGAENIQTRQLVHSMREAIETI